MFIFIRYNRYIANSIESVEECEKNSRLYQHIMRPHHDLLRMFFWRSSYDLQQFKHQ